LLERENKKTKQTRKQQEQQQDKLTERRGTDDAHAISFVIINVIVIIVAHSGVGKRGDIKI